jgi:hypothetical protein
MTFKSRLYRGEILQERGVGAALIVIGLGLRSPSERAVAALISLFLAFIQLCHCPFLKIA